MTAIAFYTQMLNSTPVLPEALLAQAFKAALAAQDRKLLRALIGREDAPASLALEYAGTDPGLLGVYQGRCRQVDTAEGREPETQTAVLVRSLKRQTPPSTAVLDALAAFGRKPTKTLADALCCLDPTAFTPEQAAALLQHAGDTSQVVAAQGRSALGARLGADLANEVLATTDTLWVVATLSQFDVSLEALAAAIVRTARKCGRDPRYHLVSAGLFETIIGRMYAPRPMGARQTLRHLIEDQMGKAGTPAERSVERYLADITVVQTSMLTWDTTPARPPTERSELDEHTPVHELAAAAASSDSAHLTNVAALVTARATEDGTANVVLTLLSNPQFATEDRRKLLAAAATHATPARRLWPALQFFDGVLAFSQDPQSQKMWVSMFPVQTIVAHGWEPFGGPAHAPDLLRTWQEQRDASALSVAEYREVLQAAAAAGLSAEALRVIPLPNLTATLSVPGAAARAVASQLSACLDDAIGTSAARWEAYTLLYDNHHGTLGELLDTIVALNS